MSPLHIHKQFDEELNELKARILALGGLVERAITNASQALLEHDLILSKKTIDHDKAINALEVQCDELTRRILVLRQPAAGDLRFIMATIKVVTDLERMGDLASGICEGVLRLRKKPKNYVNLATMSEKTLAQVVKVLDAFSLGNIDQAMELIERDKKIDALYHSNYRELLTYMLEDPSTISDYIILSNIAKNLERIGDHSKNICEMVIYMVKGHDIRHVDHEAAAQLIQEFDQ